MSYDGWRVHGWKVVVSRRNKDKEISPNSILYINLKTLSSEIQTRNDVQDKTFLILLNKNWVKDVSSHRKISIYYHVLW